MSPDIDAMARMLERINKSEWHTYADLVLHHTIMAKVQEKAVAEAAKMVYDPAKTKFRSWTYSLKNKLRMIQKYRKKVLHQVFRAAWGPAPQMELMREGKRDARWALRHKVLSLFKEMADEC